MTLSGSTPPPARWKIAAAFLLVYLTWGTTYLAISKGVESFPPALFGGVRITSAGVLLLLGAWLTGASLRLGRREILWTCVTGFLLFVCGNGLITLGQKSVASGIASVLVATTPLWLGLLESLWPRGERLSLVGWIGLISGLLGVVVLLLPRIQDPLGLLSDVGPVFVLSSAFSWALGSLVARHQRLRLPHLTAAAYQMLFGGVGLISIGFLAGEGQVITPDSFTAPAVYAFFHLLVFGSMVGYVAYNWLLGHVSATMAGTYAYVNPVVAIMVGFLLNAEPITWSVFGGMAVILSGVALVKSGRITTPIIEAEDDAMTLDPAAATPSDCLSLTGTGDSATQA